MSQRSLPLSHIGWIWVGCDVRIRKWMINHRLRHRERIHAWVKPNENLSENRILGNYLHQIKEYSIGYNIRSGSLRRNLPCFASMPASKFSDARIRKWLVQELLRNGALLTPSKRQNSLQNSDSLENPWFLSCFFAFWRFKLRVEAFKTLPQCVLKKKPWSSLRDLFKIGNSSWLLEMVGPACHEVSYISPIK